MSEKKEKNRKSTESVEESFKELDAIVAELESEQISLEKSVELFERGIKLSAVCHKKLDSIEQRIKLVVDAANADGVVINDKEE
ncbi:MAG: exodeoxyribonuclease VII small subunit [Candidatus Sumerlaeales bacterium]|nr:exodeoxyribonuclease VII small subunit [Candidatus Sumerlaeales bacterium]